MQAGLSVCCALKYASKADVKYLFEALAYLRDTVEMCAFAEDEDEAYGDEVDDHPFVVHELRWQLDLLRAEAEVGLSLYNTDLAALRIECARQPIPSWS